MCDIIPYISIYIAASRSSLDPLAEKNSKTFTEFFSALKLFTKQFTQFSFSDTDICVDNITNSTRNRRKLSSLINHFHDACTCPLPGCCVGTLIVPDVNTLGTSTMERVSLYKKLLLSNIGLIVIDQTGTVLTELSTVTLPEVVFKSDKELQDCYHAFENASETSRSGRRKKILKLDAGFIARYWCYEAYLLSEDFAVEGETSPHWSKSLLDRTVSAGTWPKLSTRSFRQTCERYENSPEYQADFLYWSDFLRNKQIDLGNIPKRFGPLPKDFLEHVPGTSPADLDVARELLNKPQLTRAELHRLHLKATASRAEILNLCKRDVNYQLIKQIIFTSQMR